jgi:ketosteroid isomerase-like protein
MARAKPSPPPASPDEIEQQFYEALQGGDLERLMEVWADGEEISCVHPGGPRVIGAVAVRASFEAIFANGTINARPERVHRLQTPACAVHSVLERVELMTPDGPQSAWVMATNVYVKAAQGWCLVAHHASPGMGREPPDGTKPSAILH